MRNVTHHLRIFGEQTKARVYCPQKACSLEIETCATCWACEGAYVSRDHAQRYLRCGELDTIDEAALLDAAYDRASPFHAAAVDEIDQIDLDHLRTPFNVITVMLEGSCDDAHVIEVAAQVSQRLAIPVEVVVTRAVGEVSRGRLEAHARQRFPRGSVAKFSATERLAEQHQRAPSTLLVISADHAGHSPSGFASLFLESHAAGVLLVQRKRAAP